MRLAALTRSTACALAIASLGAFAACSKKEPGVDEPAREGISIDVGGIDYNVFITRELNLSITPDQAYYNGKPAGPGKALYGVFIQACNNEGGKPRMTTDDFRVEDNQGEEFEPLEVGKENPFAYQPRALAKGDCIPADGSVAQLGSTAGAMLLFEFPLTITENRPLELNIRGPYDFAKGKRESKNIELDL
jgi:hypothetical protein